MTFNIRLNGQRTTCTMPAYLVALLWGEGLNDIPGWLESRIQEEPEVWEWAGQWSDTASGRLQAIASRYVANPTAREWVDKHVESGDLPWLTPGK